MELHLLHRVTSDKMSTEDGTNYKRTIMEFPSDTEQDGWDQKRVIWTFLSSNGEWVYIKDDQELETAYGRA